MKGEPPGLGEAVTRWAAVFKGKRGADRPNRFVTTGSQPDLRSRDGFVVRAEPAEPRRRPVVVVNQTAEKAAEPKTPGPQATAEADVQTRPVTDEQPAHELQALQEQGRVQRELIKAIVTEDLPDLGADVSHTAFDTIRETYAVEEVPGRDLRISPDAEDIGPGADTKPVMRQEFGGEKESKRFSSPEEKDNLPDDISLRDEIEMLEERVPRRHTLFHPSIGTKTLIATILGSSAGASELLSKPGNAVAAAITVAAGIAVYRNLSRENTYTDVNNRSQAALSAGALVSAGAVEYAVAMSEPKALALVPAAASVAVGRSAIKSIHERTRLARLRRMERRVARRKIRDAEKMELNASQRDLVDSIRQGAANPDSMRPKFDDYLAAQAVVNSLLADNPLNEDLPGQVGSIRGLLAAEAENQLGPLTPKEQMQYSQAKPVELNRDQYLRAVTIVAGLQRTSEVSENDQIALITDLLLDKLPSTLA